MNAAKMAREARERRPMDYCDKCLWRLSSGPCPRHEMTRIPELKNYRVTIRNIFRDHPRATIELEAVDPDDARDAAIEQHSMLTGFSETEYAAIVMETTP